MKKRLVSILCVLALLVSLLTVPVSADDDAYSGTCGENLTWELSDGVLTISGTGEMTDYASSTSVPWYSCKKSITSVVIQSGVTRIGSYAFYNCIYMTSIYIPSSVLTIGAKAFSFCTNLAVVYYEGSADDWSLITSESTNTYLDSAVFQYNYTIDDSTDDGTTDDGTTDDGTTDDGTTDDDTTDDDTTDDGTTDDGTTDDGTTDDGTSDDGTSDDGSTDDSTTDDGTSDDGSADDDGSDDSTESAAVASGTFGSELTLTWAITENSASNDDTSYTLTISGSGAMPDYETYADCPWADYRAQISSVVIESGVTYIGNNCLRSFTLLSDLSLPDTLTGIGDHAFYNCAVLAEVSLPSGLTEIGAYAFSSCIKLDGIVIPDTVTTIGAYAFDWCTSLTSITIPESVTSIGEYAFNYCPKLAELFLNCSITEISEAAFRYCRSLVSVTIPDTVTVIGDKAFSGCTALTSIYLPAGITAIGEAAFYECTALTDVYYADSEEEWAAVNIGLSNTCLTGASIHYNYAETLDSGSFGDALTWTLSGNGVLTISGTGDMPDFSSEEEVPWYAYRESITSVVIESGVTSIDVLAFAGCTALTAITIPASVVSIDSEAFADCTALTEVYYEGSNIDWMLLLLADLPNEEAVIACSGGTVTILASGTCGDTAYWLLTEGGMLILYGSGKTDFSAESDETVTIPWAEYADSILSVEIREGITLLDANAFQNCTNLASVSLPLSLTEIGADAFDGCTALFTVTYAGTAEDWAAVTIADGNDILTAAYAGTRVTGICGEALTWTLSDGILTISGTGAMSDYAVYEELPWYEYRSLITSAVIEEGVTTLSAYAFFACTALTSAELPETLTEIGAYAFYQCFALTDLTIPAGITAIGASAFRGCIALTEVTFEGDAPAIGENAFGGVTAAAYYPADNDTWTEEVMLDYGGALTWISCGGLVFEDVEEGTWYYDAVYWALENGITKGTSETTFSPDLSVTRAQLVTFLYRLAGSPAVDADNPFEDVNEEDYADYYDAILWAYCVGVTTGKNTEETFCPDDAVTRAEIATFLWRYYGEQAPDGITEEFLDVTDQSIWYYEAVYWAYQNGITLGMSETELIFSPETVCTRAQFVTFLYRAENTD